MAKTGFGIALTVAAAGASAADDRPDRTRFEEVRLSLIDALSGGPERYPLGRLEFACEFTKTRAGRDRRGTRAAGAAVWSGENCRWNYKRTDIKSDGPGDPGEADGAASDRISLLTAKTAVEADLGEKWATVDPTPQSGRLNTALNVRPGDSWFHLFEDASGERWPDILGRIAFSERPDARCEVTREGTKLSMTADVVRRNAELLLELTADLSDPPRITTWKFSSPGGGYLISQRSEWVREGENPARLKLLDVQNTYQGGDGRQTDVRYRIEISEFSAELPGMKPEFSVASLKLPLGTQVLYRNARGEEIREEWVGGNPPPKPDEFEEMADRLRAGRFAGGGDDQ